MTELQYLRWKFFALGMAKHCFPDVTDARRGKLKGALEDYFDTVGFPWAGKPPPYTRWGDWDFGVHDHATGYFSNHDHVTPGGRELGNKFLNQIFCCLRAGIDVAVCPSGGVVGFTIGQVREIFRRRLPQWVRDFFENDPDNELDTWPDEEPVWL